MLKSECIHGLKARDMVQGFRDEYYDERYDYMDDEGLSEIKGRLVKASDKHAVEAAEDQQGKSEKH